MEKEIHIPGVSIAVGIYGQTLPKHRRKVIVREIRNQYPGRTGMSCEYCGRPLVDCWGLETVRFKKKPDAATIEHVYSRMDIRRGCKGMDETIVLACQACNLGKANEEQKAIGTGYNYGKTNLDLARLAQVRYWERGKGMKRTFINWIKILR